MKPTEYGKKKKIEETVRFKEQKPILSKICPKCRTEVYSTLDHIGHFK